MLFISAIDAKERARTRTIYLVISYSSGSWPSLSLDVVIFSAIDRFAMKMPISSRAHVSS